MDRRTFLSSGSLLLTGAAFAKARPSHAEELSSGGWRTFEVVTRVELLKPNGTSHIWLPAALIIDTPYQKTISNRYAADGGEATLHRDKRNALGIVSGTFAPDAKPLLTLTSRVALRNHSVDMSARRPGPHVTQAELNYFLQPSHYVPTDGIVRTTALKAIAGATTDEEKARSLYEWVVKNTFRDPKVRGCGRGDIRFMLESGDMGGKCADLNALYVGLARSVGLPARHVYGLRIAKSDLGYQSLGIPSDKAT